MLLVKTKIGPSQIEGVGLFADEFIPKGKVIWKFSKEVDTAYTNEEVSNLSEPKRSEILSLHHAYKSKQTSRYVLSGDNARFMNHSFSPTVGTTFSTNEEEDVGFASRDIKNGEELTVDYRVFDETIGFEVH